MADKIRVIVTESDVLTYSGVPLPPVGLAAHVITDGILFTWDNTRDIGSFKYQYQLKIAAGAYPGVWSETKEHWVQRVLTGAERTADPASLITIKVRTCKADGTSPSAEVELGENCVPFVMDSGDFLPDSLTYGDTDAVFKSHMFVSTDLDGSEIKVGSITNTKLEDATIKVPKLNVQVTNKIFDDAAQKALIASDSAEGKLAYDKIDTDVGAGILADEPYADAAGVAAVDARFSAGEKAKLEDALDTPLAVLVAADHILISGANENLVANKVAIKTGLTLENVTNLNQVNILAGITDGILNAHTTAVTDGEVISRINDQQVGVLIDHVTKASGLRDDTGAITIFDAAGLMTAGGIKSGGVTISPANIISAIDNTGAVKTIAAGAAYSGTLDDIPQTGADKAVSANEKLGASYSFLGLHTTGYNKLGLRSGAVDYPTAGFVQRLTGSRTVWVEEEHSVGFADFVTYTVTGIGNKNIHLIQFVKCSGDTNLHFRALCQDTANLGKLNIELKTELGIVIGGGLTGTVNVNVAAFAGFEASLIVPVADPDGTAYQLWVNIEATVGAAIMSLKGGSLRVDSI